MGSLDGNVQRELQAEPGAVDEAMQWLIGAHRSAGRSLPGPSVPPGQPAIARKQHAASAVTTDGSSTGVKAATPSGHSSASSPRGSVEACCSTTATEEEALLEQMRAISRSLWSTLSSGSASGAVACTASRAAADFAWREEEVARMRGSGELDARHHRKRDAQTRHMEASARGARLRGTSAAPKAR